MIIINIKNLIIFVLCLIVEFIVFAQSYNDIDINTYGSWLTMYSYLDLLKNSPINPDNNILCWPTKYLYSVLRTDFKVNSNRFVVVFRPRIREELYYLTNNKSIQNNYYEPVIGAIVDNDIKSINKIHSKFSLYINEAYAQFILLEDLILTYGIQNYQWGPAESVSPSNKIFKEEITQKGLMYEPLGKYIFRLNYTFAQYFSIIGMIELQERENNTKSVFNMKVSEGEFHLKGLLKTEIAWEGGSNYFGIVLGSIHKDKPWVGEYLSYNISFIDGLSFYFDSSHVKGSNTYYPVVYEYYQSIQSLNYVILEQNHKSSDKIFNTYVLGLKYDLEQGSIIRLEYINNSNGYTKKDYNLILNSFSDQDNPIQLNFYKTNLEKFYLSDLDLYGKKYLYFSLYYPDVFDISDLNLYFKNISSLDDNSQFWDLSLEYSLTDNSVISSSGSLYLGNDNSFLKTNLRSNYSIFYKYHF